MKKLAVCGLLPVVNDQLFLSVSRKDDHNAIGLVGGKVDDGENVRTALIREFFEETGLVIKPIENQIPFVGVDGDFEVHTFLVELTDKVHAKISDDETGKIRVVHKDRLIEDSPFSEYNVAMFQHFGL